MTRAGCDDVGDGDDVHLDPRRDVEVAPIVDCDLDPNLEVEPPRPRNALRLMIIRIFAGLAGLTGLAALDIAPALADPTQLVVAPAGWRSDPEQATALAQRFAATSHFGGLPAVTAAEAYVAGEPGAALFVTRATATLPERPAPDEQAARVTRAALDELRASSRRASLTGGAADERAWQERVEADPRQVTATLAWTDTTSHTVEAARVVVASDGKRIVAVTGECLAGDAADRGLAACRAALATLDPGVAPASRVVLALTPASDTAPVAGAAAATAAATQAPPRESARLDDGSKVMLPPTTIPLDPPPTDRRPVYLGAGIIVLAAMFWWNRRRRDKFEREDRGHRGRPPASRNADADADDLHAAARGDGPDTAQRPDEQDASQDDRQHHD
jgi:hypothetical protein